MNALRKFREEKHMSQKQLADAVGVQPTTISRYEKGYRQLSVDKAKVIAQILEVEWTLLYNEIDDGSDGEE